MKKILRRTLSISLALAMLFGAVQLVGARLVPQAAAEYVSGIYTYEVEDDEAIITDVDGDISGDITIPSTLGGYPVTRIGSSAFWDCTGLTSVTIPDSVTSIGWYAFDECTGLTSIVIPDSVTSIDEYAFTNTGYYNNESNWENDVLYIGNHLIEVNDTISGAYAIKDGTKTIADFAFSDCTGLTCITIGNSVTSIGRYAFSWCSGLKSVTIGNSVTSIGDGAFEDCTGLTSIVIPDSVTSICNWVFSGCGGLTSIKVDADNTVYDSRNDCNAIIETETNTLISGCKNTVIPNSVTSIGDDAFDGCTGLTSITIPDSVTNIGCNAFNGCSSLESVKIPDAVENINGGAFADCYSLETIDLGNSSELQIGYSAFDGCSSIKRFIVGEDVKNYSTDDSGVLYNKNKTGLFRYTTGSENTEYTVGPNTLFIGRRAFDSSSNLKELTLPRDLMQIDTCAFDEIYSLTDVYYPGNEDEWDEICIEYGNDALLDATIHFGSCDGDDVDYAIYVNDLTMNYKESKPLDATVVLGTDTEYTVKYYSDSDNVIVDEDTGILYGAKRGSANITVEATASDGSIVISNTCMVTVEYTWWQWLIKIVLFGWIWY